MAKTVAIVGTFDTKGEEFLFIKNLFEKHGINTITIHVGTFKPTFVPDIDNKEVLKYSDTNESEIIKKKDRGITIKKMSEGLKILLQDLYAKGKIDGAISMGGSGGTSLAAPALRTLPIGVPKMIVSTVASGNSEKYIGTSDLILVPSIVDIEGINIISTKVFCNAVYAMMGMLTNDSVDYKSNKPVIAATMFGVTTPCVDTAKRYLEQKGYEVIVFHATGIGGMTMENLIRDGFFSGVLDITTTEWCDQIVGGELSAGANRGEAASVCKVPQVVSVGALDMVNFGPVESIPDKFRKRLIYKHNPMVSLMRTNADELVKIADSLVSKWNMADSDKIQVLLPKYGVSMLDTAGQPFWGPKEDKILFDEIIKKLLPDIPVEELDCNINDQAFAVYAAEKLIELIKRR